MAKVDWITWKTDPKEIVNPNEVEEKIQSIFDAFHLCMHPMIYEQLKYEVLNGGLSRSAFHVDSDSPSNEEAIRILNKIDEIQSTFEELKSMVYDCSLEQKDIEKKQLVAAIEDKLQGEKNIMKRVQSNHSVKNNIVQSGSNPNDILSVTEDRVNKLNHKLSIVDSL